MANYIQLQRTKFTDLPQGTETFGWRMYDDYGNAYNNCLNPEDGNPKVPDDDLEFLRMVMDASDPVVDGILDYMLENGKGLHVGETWYNWDQIKHLWEDSSSHPENPDDPA